MPVPEVMSNGRSESTSAERRADLDEIRDLNVVCGAGSIPS
jgi:hypothetical protein